MRKVLIITYHWPPAGGPGVQRILKFAKYLPAFGWTPLILTVANGEFPARDESLLQEVPHGTEVFKTRSLEPFALYKRLTGMPPDERIPTAVLAENALNWKTKTAHWFRLNLFIPDAKIGWLPFAVQQGKSIIRHYQPDLIFSSSPPPVVHLIAKKLKKTCGLKWVADFRDPWTDIHYYEGQNRLKIAEQLDARLELSVLTSADRISCISQLDIKLDFSRKINAEKCVNIPNGYDEEDFTGMKNINMSEDRFNLMHLGAIGPERLPHLLLKAIRHLAEEKHIRPGSFQLTFVGKVVNDLSKICKRSHLESYIKIIPYMPHKASLEQAGSASALLLLITQSKMNRRILPGKTFEYMRLGKPILALGPEDGEVARLLKESGTGQVISYQDESAIYHQLKKLIGSTGEERNRQVRDISGIEKFSRRHLTGELADLFNSIC
jgi:glycosyltransferase involved in cell wall biosynthesis